MEQHSQQSFDIIIVGAGPAGSSCALQLAGSGLSVALIDKAKFPRDKICGDALSPDVINQLQLIGVPLSQGLLKVAPSQSVSGIRFVSPNQKYLDLHFTNPCHPDSAGYIIKRLDFDDYLFEQACRLPEVTPLTGQAVTGIDYSGDGVKVTIGRSIYRASMLIGADGAYSVVSRLLGRPAFDRDHYCAGLRQYYEGIDELHTSNCIELHFYEELLPGYFWIFALPDGRANVGIGMLSSEISRQRINLRDKFREIIAHHPHVKDRFTHARPLEPARGFGLPIGSRKVSCSGERFLLLGDAACLIDPFTGEGIGNAIRSGRIAAKHIQEAFAQQKFDNSFNTAYDQEIYRRMWTELHLSRKLQKLLKFPGLFNFVVNKAGKNDSFRMLLTSMLSNIDLRQELKKPSFYTRLIFR